MKVLLAVDPSGASRKAVEFSKSLLADRSGVEVTLFHVADTPPEFILARSQADVYRSVAQDWADTHRAEGQKLLAGFREELVRAGVAATSIRTALLERESRPEASRVTASIAIIEEMKAGGYDVVILGRRGTSPQNESLIGSVADRVARESAGRTICIVD